MLASRAIVEEVCDFLVENAQLTAVVDPVFRASTGTPLLDEEGITLLQECLLPRADLATPNLGEAAFLLEREINRKEIPSVPLWLFEKYGCGFLVKGGHDPEVHPEIIDYACLDGETLEIAHPRLPVGDIHGTGCTLSAALAAFLAKGETMEDSIRKGTEYLASTLATLHRWPSPRATEALNHFPNGVESNRS